MSLTGQWINSVLIFGSQCYQAVHRCYHIPVLHPTLRLFLLKVVTWQKPDTFFIYLYPEHSWLSFHWFVHAHCGLGQVSQKLPLSNIWELLVQLRVSKH